MAIVVLIRMFISAAVCPAAFYRDGWAVIAYAANFILDMPYVPAFTDNVRKPSTFGQSLQFVIVTGICGAVLYAILAGVVAAIWRRLKKKPASFADADLSSQ